MADVAQLVEQPIRNRQVSGSSPLVGSTLLPVATSTLRLKLLVRHFPPR
jgi:hypothetical protein